MDEHQAEVEWRPYYLRPDMPPDGIELPDYKKRQIEEMKSRLTHMAGAAGLEIVFATRIPNTRLAHEATEYARDKGNISNFIVLYLTGFMAREMISAHGMYCVIYHWK